MTKINKITKTTMNKIENSIREYWANTPWWKICIDGAKWGLRIAKWTGHSPFDGDGFGF